jgi:hypothetical protein
MVVAAPYFIQLKDIAMKFNYVLTSLLLLAFVASCKKNNDHAAESEKQFTYSGSSDALSEGRINMQVFRTGDYTCFVGGDIFNLVPYGVTPSANIDVYHGPSAGWSRIALSFNRTGYAAVALNNKLLVGGGYSTPFGYTSRVDVFDLATGQLTTPSLSQPRSTLAAAGAGNKILFAGGATNSSIFNTVDIYNSETGAWTKDTLSQARASLAAAAAGNKIVFAGGIARNGNTTFYTNRVDIYDVQTGKWTEATLSHPRAQMTAISAGNKVFFAGGGSSSSSQETVDVYDVQANKWTVIILPGNTVSTIKATTNGKQVFFMSGNNFLYNKLNIYDVATGNLTTVPLAQPWSGFGITPIGNKLVMAGGSSGAGISNRLLLYDIITNSFDSTSHNINERKFEPAAATVGNKVLIAGGIFDGRNANNEREVINYRQVRVYEMR